MTTEPVNPPNSAVATACDAIDQVIECFLEARSCLPASPYEADVEAVNLFNLVIRHVEGVLALARADLVLIPPAYACARASFETAAKAAWMVNADDPFEREARWLVHLEEQERVYERAASRADDPQHTAKHSEEARTITSFRESVAKLMPSHVKLLRGNPSFEEMCRSIGGDQLYSLYIYLSQFVHGGHLASGLYRQNLGTEKKFGEFVAPSHWYIAFRLCWLSLNHPGNVVLSRVSNTPIHFVPPWLELLVIGAIEAMKSARPGELQ